MYLRPTHERRERKTNDIGKSDADQSRRESSSRERTHTRRNAAVRRRDVIAIIVIKTKITAGLYACFVQIIVRPSLYIVHAVWRCRRPAVAVRRGVVVKDSC